MAFELGEAAHAMAYFIKAVKCRAGVARGEERGRIVSEREPSGSKGTPKQKYYWESWEVCWDRQGSGGV